MPNIHGACRRALLAVVAAAALGFGTGALAAEAASVKVVYHLNEGLEQAARAMGNIRNHLGADPQAKIVVVTHGRGIDFLLRGARKGDSGGFSNDIEELALRGVEFKVCQNTLTQRKIDPATVVADGRIVPSGVAEVARLQAREGFVYLRP